MRRPPLEIQIGRLIGWPLLAVTVGSGAGCGLLVIALGDPVRFGGSSLWLLIPGVIPVCFALLSGRSVLMGTLGSFFSALIAVLIVGLYGLWKIACFVITFMGDC